MSSLGDTTNQFTGKVKWFNNKSGYGFITFIHTKDTKDTKDTKEKDIFAHHSSLNVSGEIYKYLVQGEYVEFEVQKMSTGEHEYQAVNIKGIGQNDLMCETRHKNRDSAKSNEYVTVRPKRNGPSR